uniref:Large ribosomal subunit protein P2 n=1 Tax=Esox lucius TaxID=8010 RepID=A0AAY5JZ84_ESOLU
MRYVAAYLLAVLGGNTSPSAKDIKGILGSVGIEADDQRLNKVISELNGKDINEVLNAGNPLTALSFTCLASCFPASPFHQWCPTEPEMGHHLGRTSDLLSEM